MRRIILLLSLLWMVDHVLNCSAPFESHNGICYIVHSKVNSFGLASQRCYNDNAHLANVEELSKLKSVVPQVRYVLVSAVNTFRKVADTNQELWYDEILGFHRPSSYIPWNVREPSVFPQDMWLVMMANLGVGALLTTNWNYVHKFVCVANVDSREKTFTQYRNDVNIHDYKPHLHGFTLRVKSVVKTMNRIFCLIRCRDTPACKSAYYSASTKTCIICKYTDTFLSVDDFRLASDFQRYSTN